MNRNWIVSTLAVSLLGGAAQAAVTLPRVISKNMMLQADMADPIWGTASPDEKITVEINGHKKETTAGADGKWMVKLDPEKAGGPYTLLINDTKIDNVLVGEVWHASGQSNMRFRMQSSDTAAEEIPKAKFPDIRYFSMDPYHKESGAWVSITPQDVGQFSAIAYHFAKDLHEHLKVPVAIIDTSVSGALIQTFFSPEALQSDPALAKAADTQKDQGLSTNFTPMVATIVPYGIRGVIWYQGEGNRDYPVTYQTLFAGLINDWRKDWNQGDFPFLYVQLANFRERKANPFVSGDVGLREAQTKTLSVPKTAMACTIEVAKPALAAGKDGQLNLTPPPAGNFDVMNVHYANKKPVADRLALAAYALAYGEKIEYSGPMFKDAKFDGGKAIITFTHIGGGLTAQGPVKGFLLAGEDKSWVRADAEIQGDTVVVHSPKCAQPVAVRYAYEENPECNLYNKEGLPTVPFRSDDWVQPGLKDDK